jgi:hypothetical protein
MLTRQMSSPVGGGPKHQTLRRGPFVEISWNSRLGRDPSGHMLEWCVNCEPLELQYAEARHGQLLAVEKRNVDRQV